MWWSPCPSRECPDDEKLSLVLHECLDHCLLLPQKNETNTILKGVHESIAARPPTLLCPGNGVSIIKDFVNISTEKLSSNNQSLEVAL